ncbi:DJ-1/PfpI family protein [Sphingobium sp.]|uniref:DJ-1/PfpI family protein n=1 Tax=Sphingobium sp. TaxID=1912891 RepID=UPI003B3B6808
MTERPGAGQSRRYGSTCTGAFLLAHAGLLAGRRATTHWEYAERLAADFPDIQVEPDHIFVRDDRPSVLPESQRRSTLAFR